MSAVSDSDSVQVASIAFFCSWALSVSLQVRSSAYFQGPTLSHSHNHRPGFAKTAHPQNRSSSAKRANGQNGQRAFKESELSRSRGSALEWSAEAVNSLAVGQPDMLLP